MIVSVLAILVAVVSLGVSVSLWQRVRDLTRQCEETRRAIAAGVRTADSPALEAKAAKPLEGLRVALVVSQDHPHPVFASLLKERLLREDVSSIEVLGGSPADALRAWNSGRVDADVLVAGGLTCNGYAEVYYHAEFTCYSRGEAVCTVVEKPSGGDRPDNLALEIVSLLGGKLEDLVRRGERRRAIAELHEP